MFPVSAFQAAAGSSEFVYHLQPEFSNLSEGFIKCLIIGTNRRNTSYSPRDGLNVP
jgi:hypothetical protein